MSYRNIEPLMSDDQRANAAHRLISAAGFNPEDGDTEVITNMGIGYADGGGGYGMSDIWVTGNWNDVTRYEDGERIVTSTMPSRLFDALERLGVNGEWLDEWEKCSDCSKLIRSQPDCHMWTPQFVLTEDCEYVCRGCMQNDRESWVDDYYANHVERAVTWLSAMELREMGWHDAFPGEPDTQTGFHPGQDGTPAAMVSHLYANEDNDGRDWVFLITDKGQFDISYRLFVRNDENGE